MPAAVIISANWAEDRALLGSNLSADSVASTDCPASMVLSGQRQSDFPIGLRKIPAAVGAVGKVGIPRVLRDFQGRWEARETCFWFSSLSTARLFPQPNGRRVFPFSLLKKHGHSVSSRTPSLRPDSSWLVPCDN